MKLENDTGERQRLSRSKQMSWTKEKKDKVFKSRDASHGYP